MRQIVIFTILATLSNCEASWRNFLRDFGEPSRIMFRSTAEKIEEYWFTQYLNHFDYTDDRVWKQRYFINEDYYKPGGPVFMFIGAESPASPSWLQRGQMFDEAKRFGAKMFLLEHRFYGNSQPTSDLSIKNLTYLNTQQALADLAYFIEGINKSQNLTKDTKWVVFGCSYAGSLAAWLRAKYPHLVHAAISCSGPLLAQVDFPEYMITMEASLKTHSQSCLDVLSSATSEMNTMIQNPDGQQKLEKLFKLCDPIDSKNTTKKDIANLYESIADNFAYVVQYNKNNRDGKKLSIDSVCDVLVNKTKGTPIDRLAEVNNMILNSNREKCLDYKYSKLIKELTNDTLTRENRLGGRQWTYQTCTEFGFYQTSTATPKLFGDHFPIDFFLDICVDIFGPQFEKLIQPGIDRTNRVFGALNLENLVTKVVFVHGNIDPWHPLGIIKSSNPNAPAIFINGTAHCATIYPASKNDLLQLTEARTQISRLIGQWLQD